MAAATAVAIGATLASAGMSAAQAAKQSRMQKQAEAEAAKAIEEARKRLDINFYDKLSVKKEPYELAIEASNVAAAQALEAGRESERGTAATAGRVLMADNDQQRKIATLYGEELMGLERLTADEEARLRDANMNIDLAQAQGAQLAARDAQEAKAVATNAAINSGISAVGQGITAASLYKKDTGAQKDAAGKTEFSPDEFNRFGNVKNGEQFGFSPAMDGTTNLDLQVIKNMDRGTYKKFIDSLSPEQRAVLFNSQSFIDNYNPFNIK